MTLRSIIAAGACAFAVAISSDAKAAVVDFTQKDGSVNWLGGFSQTNFIAGIGNVTITSFGGDLAADTIPLTVSPPCASAPNLACNRDGVGISDDEITFGIDPGELLRVTFNDTAVNITEIGFLDLFAPPKETLETASWNSNGAGVNAAGSIGGTGVSYGWVLFSGADITGVTSIDFFVDPKSTPNSDFALAYLNVTPVPLPAALPLFLSALAGLALVGRRQRKKAGA